MSKDIFYISKVSAPDGSRSDQSVKVTSDAVDEMDFTIAANGAYTFTRALAHAKIVAAAVDLADFGATVHVNDDSTPLFTMDIGTTTTPGNYIWNGSGTSPFSADLVSLIIHNKSTTQACHGKITLQYNQ